MEISLKVAYREKVRQGRDMRDDPMEGDLLVVDEARPVSTPTWW